MIRELPSPGDDCPHCGYRHHKAGGHLKYYLGAMVCPVYVQLITDEMETWGLRVRRAPEKGRESRLQKCTAPDDFVCFHKGVVDTTGRRRCYSPDGFSTQVPEDKKLKMVSTGSQFEAVDLNDELICEFIASYRRPPRKKSGRRARSHGASKGSTEASFNEMPSTGDPRRQDVYSELFGRISYLKDHRLPVTAETIAAMSGHAAWKNRDVHTV